MLQHIKNWLRVKSLTIAVIVSLVVVVLSLLNMNSGPSLPIKVSDKLLHGLAYLVLMWSWLFYFRDKKSLKTRIILIISLTLLGIILEILQGVSLIGRTQDFNDVLANVIGLIIGIVSFDFLYTIIFKKQHN